MQERDWFDVTGIITTTLGAIFSLLAVIVSLFIAVNGWKKTDRRDQEREEQAENHVVFKLRKGNTNLVLSNVGTGKAKNIELSADSPGISFRPKKIPELPANCEEEIVIKEGNKTWEGTVNITYSLHNGEKNQIRLSLVGIP